MLSWAWLHNPSVMCYANALFQAIFYDLIFDLYIDQSKSYVSDCFCIGCILIRTSLTYNESDRPFTPILYHQWVKCNESSSLIIDQEDVHELFLSILHHLVLSHTPSNSFFDHIPKQFENSIVSSLICNVCGNLSQKHNAEVGFLLQLSQSIQSSLLDFFHNDLIEDYFCSNCGRHTTATQRMDSITAPEILCISLKRFDNSNHRINNFTYVTHILSIPIQTSDLSHYVEAQYELISFICHDGHSPRSGHYYTCRQIGGHFYQVLDDSIIQINRIITSIHHGVYLLFYKKLEDKTTSVVKTINTL